MAELPSSPGLAAIRETAAYKLLCWRRAGAKVLVNDLGVGPDGRGQIHGGGPRDALLVH